MIVLADQSPWVGGLLRLRALRDAGEEAAYYVADLDTPTAGGDGPISISEGWPDYSSVVCRYPWTIDAPGTTGKERSTASMIANSLKLPRGLQYVVGNRNSTLHSLNSDPSLNTLIREMLEREITWATTVATLRGCTAPKLELPFGSVRGIASELSSLLSVHEPVGSTMELFRNEPPKLWGTVPKEHFWEIFPGGARYSVSPEASRPSAQAYYAHSGEPMPPLPRGTMIPRGKILALEFMARGWELGCTNLSYIGEVVRIRNLYLPGVPIRLVKVKFHWTLPGGNDPLEVLKEQFFQKKRERGGLKPTIETEIEQLVTLARVYWQNRPSVISYLMLGGDLGATITREVL